MTAAAVAGARRRLTIVFVGFVALGLFSSTFGAVWPELRRTFHQPVSALTWIGIASTIGYSSASAASARLARRFGLAAVLVVSAAVIAVTMLLQAVDTWWLAVPFLAMIAGAAGGAVDTSGNTYVATYHGVRAMGVLHAMFGVGAVLSPLTLSAMLQAGSSWRPVFVVAGGLFAVVGVLLLANREGWGGGRSTLDASSGEHVIPAAGALAGEAVAVVPDGRLAATTVSASATPRVALGVAFFVANVAFELTIGNWGSSFLRDLRHLPKAVTQRWLAGFWAVFTVARVALGWLTARLGEWRVLDASIGSALLGAVVITFVPGGVAAGVGMLLCGAGIAALFPLHTSLTVRRVGAQRAATVIGYQIAAAGVGSALQAALLGWISATVGLRAFGPALLAIGVAMAVVERVVRRAAIARVPSG